MEFLSKLFATIAKFLAIPLLIALLLYFIDRAFPLLPGIPVFSFVLQLIAQWGALVLAGLIALSVTFKLHPILVIIISLLLIAVVVFEILGSAEILKDIIGTK